MSMRKKWCEACKLNIPYTRADIVDHENSARHKQNNERMLREQNKQARKQNMQNGRFTALSVLPDDNRNKQSNKKNQHQQHQQQQKDEDQEYFDKWKAPFEEKGNHIADAETFLDGKVWVLEEEEDTKKFRFRNTLTNQIKYDKPMGLNLEDYEQEAWDEYQERFKAGLIIDTSKIVKIGQWEEVKQEDNFFEKYKTIEESQSSGEENYIRKETIEEKIANGKIQKQSDLLKELLVENHTDNFNQKLRELAEQDIDLNLAMPKFIKEKPPQEKINTNGLFKKRKLNQNTQINVAELND